MSNLRKWADEHQYDAPPQPNANEDRGVEPSVYLIHMTEDPLGTLAAHNGIYKGNVIRHLSEVTDDMRREALDDMMKTTLQSPLETIRMHWMIEGIDRAITHQVVRNRTGNYGQESLRFSVVGDLIDATTVPPGLQGTERSKNTAWLPRVSFEGLVNERDFTYATQDERNRAVWDWNIMNTDAAYHYLVEHGIAAEEARGLLPHCTATRMHYQLNMRDLKKVMGERLCTQAQFPWRQVATLMREAIRNYTPDFSWSAETHLQRVWEVKNRWQFELLADSGIFRPVCFHTGQCMFKASADRGCTIRQRVDDNDFDSIREEEWRLNPAAARKQS